MKYAPASFRGFRMLYSQQKTKGGIGSVLSPRRCRTPQGGRSRPTEERNPLRPLARTGPGPGISEEEKLRSQLLLNLPNRSIKKRHFLMPQQLTGTGSHGFLLLRM